MRVRKLPFNGRYTVLSACDGRGTPILLSFLEGLGPNLQKDMTHMIALLERVAVVGPPRNTEISHKIDGEIWEFIKGRLRVFYFYDEGHVVVCTHGLVKKSQKTPKADLAHAEQVRKIYLAAKQAGALIIEEDE